MAIRQRRYPNGELARRGTELYEQRVRLQVEVGNHGRIAGIDIDTGPFELADTTLDAATRLLARLPDAQIWSLRIGYKAVHFIGCCEARNLRSGWSWPYSPTSLELQ